MSANVIETTLTFDSSDYNIISNELGDSYIIANSESATYMKDSAGFCMPVICRRIGIEGCEEITDIKYYVNYSTYRNEISIGKDLRKLTLSSINLRTDTNNHIVSGDNSSNIAICNVIDNFVHSKENSKFSTSFSVCPFRYNEATKTLDFLSSIRLVITYRPYNTKNEIEKRIPSDISKLLNKSIKKSSSLNNHADNTYLDSEERVDYAIITNEHLKSEFQRLLEWKQIKGLKTIILSTEEIFSTIEGEDEQSKIKQTLYWLYTCYGLKYALLGGDDSIIPVRYCKASENGLVRDDIPADIYYSSLSGSFNWDDNNNGIYGEVADNINLTPQIYISRLPVRTADQAKAIVDKTLKYEQNPLKYGWNNRVLMAGTSIDGNIYNGTQSDAELLGEKLYSLSFNNLWNGNRIRLYDTLVEDGISSYNHDSKSLQNQLSAGAAFVDVICHGGIVYWTLNKDVSYGISNANQLICNKPMLVSTIACNTNHFDGNTSKGGERQECLSEAFIRNPNSGVYAYLGGSREGWVAYLFDTVTTMGSIGYEQEFYDLLFDVNNRDKSYGFLCAKAKHNRATYATRDGMERWIQFSLNPIGDPEMYIFPTIPKYIKGGTIVISDSTINISTIENDCNVSVSFLGDNIIPETYKKNSTSSFSLQNHGSDGYIYIGKPGYIPVWFYFKNGVIYLENDILDGDWKIECDAVCTGSHNAKSHGVTIVNNGSLKIKAKETIFAPGTTVPLGSILNVNN